MTLYIHPSEGEGTLISFYAKMAGDVSDGGREALNHIAQALIERGWLPTVSGLIEQLSEIRKAEQTKAILDDLVHKRLLSFDESGEKIVTFLGSISTVRTPHQAKLDSGSDLFFLGGMELLAAAPLFGMKVKATTQCPQTGDVIELVLENEGITHASPTGIAGFQATWDGEAPLADVYSQSNLFSSDEALDAWTSEHADVDGLPMAADLLLFIGMGMAVETGNARYKLIGM